MHHSERSNQNQNCVLLRRTLTRSTEPFIKVINHTLFRRCKDKHTSAAERTRVKPVVATLSHSQALNFTVKISVLVPDKSFCKQNEHNKLQSYTRTLSLYAFYWSLSSHPTRRWDCEALSDNRDSLFFFSWSNSAKIYTTVINRRFTQEERVSHRALVLSQLLNNLFLLVYDQSSPQAPSTDLSRLTPRERQKKRNSASSEPLPLTVGLLIQTIKAFALGNPCFKFAAWAWSCCSGSQSECAGKMILSMLI